MGISRTLRGHLLSILGASFFFAAVVFAGFWVWSDVPWVDQLAPNVITEGIGLGLALTVIDRAVRDRDRRRVQPLVDQVLASVRLGVSVFAMNLAFASGLRPSTHEDVPRDAVGFLRYWLGIAESSEVGYALAYAAEFSSDTLRYVDENRHDLPAELAAEARRASGAISLGPTMATTALPESVSLDFPEEVRDLRIQFERLGAKHAVSAVTEFVELLEKLAPSPTGPVQVLLL